MSRRKTPLLHLFSQIGKPLYWAAFFAIHYFVIEKRRYQQAYIFRRKRTKEVLIYYKPQFFNFRINPKHFSLLFLCVLFLLSARVGNLAYFTIFKDLPSPEDLRNHHPQLTTKIYDRNGVLLYKIYKNQNRSLAQLSDLPPTVIAATISIEDKDFYSHRGISLTGIIRALRSFLTDQGIQGGSTITQQLVKTVLLSPERTVTRKIREALLALEVERHFSKNQILEMYLNEISYGGSAYGIEEAARTYFDIPAKQLDLAQAAFLAGLPQAPSLYNPFGTDPERGIARQRQVLERMFEDKKISAIQLEQAEHEKLSFAVNGTNIRSPHFIMFAREQLAKTYGEELLAQGGLEITTTLDEHLQEQVQQIVTNEVSKIKNLRVGNGAALVTNPKTGEVLAMVGSVNYFDTANDGQVNVTVRPRQPGSSIKPVTYAAALERGFSPSTILIDEPVSFSIPGSPPYAPRNYDGRFHGNVTLRTALANSFNIPAVETENSIGVQTVIEKGRQLGITTWTDPSRYGLSLTLGGAEVKMTDMAEVYGTFANLGITVPLQFILTIKTSDGKVLYQNPCVNSTSPCGGEQTLDERIAYQLTNILMDNDARALEFGLHSVLTIPNQEVAVKTGTTNSLRDNWTDGYITDRVVIVWVGNNNNTPMSRVTSGIIGASPIWNSIMQQLLQGREKNVFPIPNNLIALNICRQTGLLSCGQCGPSVTEYFLPGSEPTQCSSTPTPTPNSQNQTLTKTYPLL